LYPRREKEEGKKGKRGRERKGVGRREKCMQLFSLLMGKRRQKGGGEEEKKKKKKVVVHFPRPHILGGCDKHVGEKKEEKDKEKKRGQRESGIDFSQHSSSVSTLVN